MIKIATFGWRSGILGQIQQVEEGLKRLGTIITYDNPDIIFAWNPSYEEILSYAEKWPKAKRIFNVLDCPIHLGQSYPWETIQHQLAAAHAITSISKTTAAAVKEIYGFNSQVIYAPMRDIYRIPSIKKDISILFSGRCHDPNKRFNLIAEVAQKLNMELHVCGPENPGVAATYYGVVEDFKLNELYNRAKYYICCTKNAGIELGPIQASFAGCIPIVTNDTSTAYEFFHDFLADPNADSIANRIKTLEEDRVKISQELITAAPRRYFHLQGIEVARKIIEIYKTL